MRIRTTTAQINAALPLLELINAECYNKDTRQVTTIDSGTFDENLQFLNEAGSFVECIGWNCELTGREVIIETGRKNAECDCIITAYLRLNDGVSKDGLENILRKVED